MSGTTYLRLYACIFTIFIVSRIIPHSSFYKLYKKCIDYLTYKEFSILKRNSKAIERLNLKMNLIMYILIPMYIIIINTALYHVMYIILVTLILSILSCLATLGALFNNQRPQNTRTRGHIIYHNIGLEVNQFLQICNIFFRFNSDSTIYSYQIKCIIIRQWFLLANIFILIYVRPFTLDLYVLMYSKSKNHTVLYSCLHVTFKVLAQNIYMYNHLTIVYDFTIILDTCTYINTYTCSVGSGIVGHSCLISLILPTLCTLLIMSHCRVNQYTCICIQINCKWGEELYLFQIIINTQSFHNYYYYCKINTWDIRKVVTLYSIQFTIIVFTNEIRCKIHACLYKLMNTDDISILMKICKNVNESVYSLNVESFKDTQCIYSFPFNIYMYGLPEPNTIQGILGEGGRGGSGL